MNETPEARVARLKEMGRSLTLAEIATREDRSIARISQLIGKKRAYINPLYIRLYCWIEGFDKEHHLPPSTLEIAEAFPAKTGKRRSTSVVSYWLRAMEKLKLLRPRQTGRSRSIVTTPRRQLPEYLAKLVAGK